MEALPGGSEVKAFACNAGDLGSIPGSGRSPGEGSGNPLQYACLENPMEREAWWATVHGVTKSQTRLSDFTHSHMYVINTYTYAHTQPHRELINSIRYVKSEVVQMKPLAGD